MLQTGQKAPTFTLPAGDGRTVSLADLKGKTVVLYFYPRDNTPGCTREAEGFRDAHRELESRGAVVLGVSRDSAESHARFAEKLELGFRLLSDPEAKVISAYGAWGEKVRYGKRSEGTIRTTVIIDGEGKVARVFPDVKVDGHVAKVLEALDALG